MFLWVCDHPHLPHSVQYDKFGSYRCPPPNAPIAPKGARPLPSLTNAAFEDFSDQDCVASRTSRLIQEASGGTKTEWSKKTKIKIKRHTNQEGQPSKDFLDGIGCRYVDLQFDSLYSRDHVDTIHTNTKKRQ